MTLAFPVADSKLTFSDKPGWRTVFVVDLERRPKFLLSFLDLSEAEELARQGGTGSVVLSTGRTLARGGGGARADREAWRKALQALASEAGSA